MTDRDRLRAFVELSSALTGFSAFELQGTGQAEAFCSTVAGIAGDEVLGALLDAFGRVRAEAGEDRVALEPGIRREILSDLRLGPVARNVIKLWYVGTWYELPPVWVDAYGASDENITFGISPEAYTESLLWPAVGANPPGAKGPGYASWTGPPRIPGSDRQAQGSQ
jgi:hypothetical protein